MPIEDLFIIDIMIFKIQYSYFISIIILIYLQMSFKSVGSLNDLRYHAQATSKLTQELTK